MKTTKKNVTGKSFNKQTKDVILKARILRLEGRIKKSQDRMTRIAEKNKMRLQKIAELKKRLTSSK